MRPNRGQTLANAPLEDLLTILIRQFRRPLAAHGAHIGDAEAEALARTIVTDSAQTPLCAQVRAAMIDVIAESERVLAQWNLTFEQSLDTPMDRISGWDTTAEFLDIANEKANAELRIAAGAALLTALGDPRHAARLVFMVERDAHDTDALIGRRMLSFVAQIDPQSPAWLAQARAWVDKHTASDVH